MKAVLSVLLVVVFAAGLGAVRAAAQADICPPNYIVQGGDSLAKIAVKCHVSLRTLMLANPQLANPNLLRTGMVISVPGSAVTVTPGATTAATATAAAATSPAASPTVVATPTAVGAAPGVPVTGQAYSARPGDTLSRISSTYGVTIESITALNPGIDRYTIIYPGMNLVIPTRTGGPLVSISPSSGLMGTTITLVAAGFPPNQLVRVGFGPQSGDVLQLDLTTTAADGTLSRRYLLPASANRDGAYVFVVQKADEAVVHGVSNLFTAYGTGVSAAGVPVTGLPSSDSRAGTRGSLVSISPTTAGAGDRISVAASGFPPNASVDIRIGKQGEEPAGYIDAIVDSSGRVSASIPVPAGAKFGETWVVTVGTTDRLDATTAVSGPITIFR